MIVTGRTNRKISGVLAVLSLFLPIFAAICVADGGGAAPLILTVRPELLPDVSSLADKVAVPARNPFIWPVRERSKLEQLENNNMVDPFAELTLHGIITVNDTLVVIINNTQLQKGDTIDGIMVREITADSVVLATRKTRRTLRFPSSGIDFSSTPRAEVE